MYLLLPNDFYLHINKGNNKTYSFSTQNHFSIYIFFVKDCTVLNDAIYLSASHLSADVCTWLHDKRQVAPRGRLWNACHNILQCHGQVSCGCFQVWDHASALLYLIYGEVLPPWGFLRNNRQRIMGEKQPFLAFTSLIAVEHFIAWPKASPLSDSALLITLWILEETHTHTPGVEERSIKQWAVVVVTYKVPSNSLPGAGLRHLLIGHCDAVSGVVEVQQNNVKHQRCLSWDVAAWRAQSVRSRVVKWQPKNCHNWGKTYITHIESAILNVFWSMYTKLLNHFTVVRVKHLFLLSLTGQCLVSKHTDDQSRNAKVYDCQSQDNHAKRIYHSL